MTAGTVFAKHKKSLRDILTSALMWINSAGGQPALELKRHMDTTYITPFILQHKLREGPVRGYKVGLINSDVEMDGARQSGWRAAESKGTPPGSPAIDETTDVQTLNATMLTQTALQARSKKRSPWTECLTLNTDANCRRTAELCSRCGSARKAVAKAPA